MKIRDRNPKKKSSESEHPLKDLVKLLQLGWGRGVRSEVLFDAKEISARNAKIIKQPCLNYQ